MSQVLSMLRPALVLLLAFMVVAVDFTSYLLSAVGDFFFVGALVVLVWPAIKPAKEQQGDE
ncbi:DUF3927 family protein [Kluyvera ascorbata]|uniref:DUF3927 family protein n=1 Tax=Kluyvera ascorbata TaxID=51288 RepID=UPI0029026FE9|nr:DUF3927 family protein [Kluyvera ascorbata]MDU1197015.1 DUF3927 family protein [Kluyvera ascorbata]